MPRKDKSEQGSYMKQYRLNHTQQEKTRKSSFEYKAQQRDYIMRKRLELKRKTNEIFPLECFFCGDTVERHLEMHEIHNRRHAGSGTEAKKYYLSHRNDFVRLCRRCHRWVSWVHKVFGKTWKDIVEFLGLGDKPRLLAGK
jgi:5-methylcytosine-specific restriction endonuclease McrA